MVPRACRLNIILWVLTILVVLLSALTAAAGTTSDRLYYVPNEYIIHVQQGTSFSTVEQLVDRMGASVIAGLSLADTYHIKLGRTGSGSTIRAASTASTPVKWVIDHIQPNYIYAACAEPNDEYWENDKLWGMKMINMPQAWDITKGSDDVIVGVVDSGVANHLDLAGRLIDGYDFVEKEDDASDDVVGHGTHVAGTIAAQGDNSIGVVGVCWDGVKIMPLRVLGDDGEGSTDLVTDALDYAKRNGVKVVNMSLGPLVAGAPADESLHEKIKELDKAGIILVAAAGNFGLTNPTALNYPAAFPEVISVSAVDYNENRAPYSSYGYTIDIAAPGGNTAQNVGGIANRGIWSTFIEAPASTPEAAAAVADGVYKEYQGTSMACPHVAGAAALLLSNGVPASQVRSRLLNTARPPKSGTLDREVYGAGILDVSAALSSASVKILQPGKGATVSSNPQIKISLFGITASSVKVYLDPRLDANGIPDPTDTAAIISTNVTSGNSTYTINWPMSAGQHTVYVQGDSALTGQTFSDWATFSVAAQTLSAGLHLVALPYDFATTTTGGSATMSAFPEDLFRTLEGNLVNFQVMSTTKSTLTRWVAKTSSARSMGYFTYPQDVLAWENPFDSSWYTGGGFYSGNYAFPAGSGFWLVLPQDVVVNDAYAAKLIPSNTAFSMSLYQGWNMFGNPYNKQVSWNTALFLYRGQVKTLVEAEAAGWIRSTIFSYTQTPTRGYQRVSNRGLLDPYNGYWLYALVGGVRSSDSLVMTILP